MPSHDPSVVEWLLECAEPWTRYRTLTDLLNQPEHAAQVLAARAEMVAHQGVRELIERAATWPISALRRHNDSGHAIYALSTLADFGLRHDDAGVEAVVAAVMAHQSAEGAFQTLLNIPRAYGGTNDEVWAWMACDAPTVLYSLVRFGMGEEPSIQRAVNHLVALVADNGWRCSVATELGKFRGPGRRNDPCPIANVYALKVLALVPGLRDGEAAQRGAQMLLEHWAQRHASKFYLFGVGTDFRKLKYPFVWYDILHVADVLSQFRFVHCDARFSDMIETITAQADDQGRYTAGSLYRPWVGWSFADKKHPSPWLTLLVLRILHRVRDGA